MKVHNSDDTDVKQLDRNIGNSSILEDQQHIHKIDLEERHIMVNSKYCFTFQYGWVLHVNFLKFACIFVYNKSFG